MVLQEVADSVGFREIPSDNGQLLPSLPPSLASLLLPFPPCFLPSFLPSSPREEGMRQMLDRGNAGQTDGRTDRQTGRRQSDRRMVVTIKHNGIADCLIVL